MSGREPLRSFSMASTGKKLRVKRTSECHQRGYVEGSTLNHPLRAVTALRTHSQERPKIGRSRRKEFPRDVSLGWGFGGKTPEKGFADGLKCA